MKRVFLATVVSAAFAAAAPLAIAQSAEPATEAPSVMGQAAQPGTQAQGAQGQRQRPARQALRAPTERVEARLAYLRTALKITDAQQPQWESFASVLRNQARDREQRIAERRAQGAKPRDARSASAIDRLERSQKRMEARAKHLNEVLTAAKPLYASLSPEQQQVADRMISQRGGKGRPHQHRGGGMRRS